MNPDPCPIYGRLDPDGKVIISFDPNTIVRTTDYTKSLPTRDLGELKDLSVVTWGEDGAKVFVDINPPVKYDYLANAEWHEFAATFTWTDHAWRYHQRWNAQMILPFLYLGPTTVCKKEFLTDARVSMIVPVRALTSSTFVPYGASLNAAKARGIHVEPVDVFTGDHLIAKLEHVISMINQHLSAPENAGTSVLICCESGNDRSAALAAAYCMGTVGLDAWSAVRVVQNARFGAAITDTVKTSLLAYNDFLQARRSVAQANATVNHTHVVTKRERDTDHDEDMTNGQELDEDVARFQAQAFAPFADAGAA